MRRMPLDATKRGWTTLDTFQPFSVDSRPISGPWRGTPGTADMAKTQGGDA